MRAGPGARTPSSLVRVGFWWEYDTPLDFVVRFGSSCADIAVGLRPVRPRRRTPWGGKGSCCLWGGVEGGSSDWRPSISESTRAVLFALCSLTLMKEVAMRRVIFLAGLALAVGVLVPGSALPAVGGSDLPLKGSFSGTTTHNLVTGHLDAVSTGELTHFGLATLEQSVQVAATGPTTRSWSGTWTLTAAKRRPAVRNLRGYRHSHRPDAHHIRDRLPVDRRHGPICQRERDLHHHPLLPPRRPRAPIFVR